MTKYLLGKTVRCTGAFSVSGVYTDPNTVTFKYLAPGETVVTYVYGVNAVLVRDSAGIYHVDLLVDVSGSWWYRFEGTGSVANAEEKDFFVAQGRF